MVAFSQRRFRWARRAVCVGSVGWCCATAALGMRVDAQSERAAWDAAVLARQVFEAEPQGTHTREEYDRVMDGFRAIYHGDPINVHAAAAVEQVAQLLTEEGREFGEARWVRDAAGQYDFLLAQYPMSRAARESRGKAEELRADLERPGFLASPMSGPLEQARVVAPDESAPVSRVEVSAPDAGAAQVQPVSAERDAAQPMALVTGIRHWSTPTYTRVAIDLGEAVTYQAARVENPDRIYFDLHHARLAHDLVGKSFAVTDDGFLIRIRAAQFSNDVTRVVLDVHQVTEYSAFLLPNPYRLIIDIHGKPAAAANGVTVAENASASQEQAVTPARVNVAPVPASGTETSSLPPMAVTDGSANFGLPSRRNETYAQAEQVAPRVVIPTEPTASRPVPNAVASRTGDSGTELAAVSLQPGLVEATREPTDAPIVAKTPAPAVVRRRTRRSRHVVGEPAEAAAPMADGQTSLMRALGLKIGRIVIDAGHGGHDSGTLGYGGVEEKDVVLDVALKLGKLLHDRLGAQVVYTRDDDTFIPLETRTAIANKAQADLFISIHANSSSDPDVRGVEVYYLNFTSDPDAMRVASRENAVSSESVYELSSLVKQIALKDKIEESRELATDVDQSLYAGLERGNPGLKNRGVKKAPFVVLIGANMPSILAEISFVTNPEDARELVTPAYQERVAESLYKGIARYAESINGDAPRHDGADEERASLKQAADQ